MRNDPLTNAVLRHYAKCIATWNRDAGNDASFDYKIADIRRYSREINRDDNEGYAVYSLGIGDEGGNSIVFVRYNVHDGVPNIVTMFQEFDTSPAIMYWQTPDKGDRQHAVWPNDRETK